jgi:hypothetical protein
MGAYRHARLTLSVSPKRYAVAILARNVGIEINNDVNVLPSVIHTPPALAGFVCMLGNYSMLQVMEVQY